MFPELSSLIHDYLRPITRPDWRRLHKYKDSDLKYTLINDTKPICKLALLNSKDGGCFPKFKNMKVMNGMRVIFINDYIIVLRGKFIDYYYIYTNETILKDNVLYRDLDILGELYFKKIRYVFEFILICFFGGAYIVMVFCK